MRTASAIALLLCSLASGQQLVTSPANTPQIARYQTNFTASLSTAATALTVQGTTTANEAYFETGDVYCSAACVATISINGTAATATAATVTAIGVASVANPLTAWSASNVGSPTALKVYNIAAGATQIIDRDLVAFYFPAGAPKSTNLTISIASVTATVRIQLQWRAD